MDTITFAWMEAGQRKTQTFVDTFSTEETWTIRIGRDPAQCDLVLPSLSASDRTVSRLHVEIIFNPSHASFYLRNLKSNNPVTVDSQTVTGEVVLKEGSIIRMGEVEVSVASLSDIPQTVFATGEQSPATPIEPISQTVESVPLNVPFAVDSDKQKGKSTELATIPKVDRTPVWWEGLAFQLTHQLKSLPKLTLQSLLKPIPITIGLGALAAMGTTAWWRSQTIFSHKAFFNSRVLEVRAPISGELRLKGISSGQMVQAGAVLGHVHDPRNLALQRAQRNLVSQLENLAFRQEQLQVQLADRKETYRELSQQTEVRHSPQETMVGRRQAELQQAIQAADRAEAEVERVQESIDAGVVPADALARAEAAKQGALELVRSRREQLAAALLETQQGGSTTVAASPQQIAQATRRLELQNEVANFEQVLQDLQFQTDAKQAELDTIRKELEVQTPVALVTPKNGELWRIDSMPDSTGMVVEGDPIANIATCEDIWVEAFVSEGDAKTIEVGSEAKVILSDNFFDRPLLGVVREVNPQVDALEVDGGSAIPPQTLRQGEVAVLVDIEINSSAGVPQFCDVGRNTEVRFPRRSSSES